VLEQPRFKLERLILENCRITDEGVKPIAKALEYNQTLRFLDLSHNSIKETGASYLGHMLLQNGTLNLLFLNWNPLSPKGGLFLASALQKNQTLLVLDLGSCCLSGPRGSLDQQLNDEIKLQQEKL
jgi:Ran GTPase-activating protein (RanGAP) involved in mRNA processing and transport